MKPRARNSSSSRLFSLSSPLNVGAKVRASPKPQCSQLTWVSRIRRRSTGALGLLWRSKCPPWGGCKLVCCPCGYASGDAKVTAHLFCAYLPQAVFWGSEDSRNERNILMDKYILSNDASKALWASCEEHPRIGIQIIRHGNKADIEIDLGPGRITTEYPIDLAAVPGEVFEMIGLFCRPTC